MPDSPSDRDRLAAAIERICAWTRANGAPLLADNLAPPASPAALEGLERELASPLPASLCALWSLHGGQREPQNPFFETLDFLAPEGARFEREGVLMFLEFLREHPEDWDKAHVTDAEARSDAWVPFAQLDSDSLIIHAATGRVFSCGKDAPPIALVADSLVAYLEKYADEVTSDHFAVEEGFGDYFLSRRNLEQERRDAERASARETFRRETPLLEQFRDAIERDDTDRGVELLEGAREVHPELFAQYLDALLAPGVSAGTVTQMVRPIAGEFTLAADRWVDVAVAAAEFGNSAIVDLAVARAGGASAERLEALRQKAAKAAGDVRARLDHLAARLRQPEAAPAPGLWSRIFGKKDPKA